jgi:CD209 antigen
LQLQHRHRCVGLLPLCLLAWASACNFDPSTTATGASEDAAVADAQVLDDGALVPDATPADAGPPPDAFLLTGPCGLAPFVARPENGHAYYFEMNLMNYDEAQASCMANRGHLVVINDVDEDAFVIAMGMEPWIGFNDLDVEDGNNNGASFAWVNGETPAYSKWKTGQPNDGPMKDEDCTHIKMGEWDDKKCGENRVSVCECDPANLVDPAPACMTNSAYDVIQGRRYRRETDDASFDDAKDNCEAEGGYLVVISDLKENSYAISIAGSNTWIGLNDIASEGNFVWVTDSASSYTNWLPPSEPNAGTDEDCTEFRSSGEWNDEVCANTQDYVCECDPLYQAP